MSFKLPYGYLKGSITFTFYFTIPSSLVNELLSKTTIFKTSFEVWHEMLFCCFLSFGAAKVEPTKSNEQIKLKVFFKFF